MILVIFWMGLKFGVASSGPFARLESLAPATKLKCCCLEYINNVENLRSQMKVVVKALRGEHLMVLIVSFQWCTTHDLSDGFEIWGGQLGALRPSFARLESLALATKLRCCLEYINALGGEHLVMLNISFQWYTILTTSRMGLKSGAALGALRPSFARLESLTPAAN
jgi:hypothetical protein